MSVGQTLVGNFGGVASKAGASGLSMTGLAAGPAGLIASAGVGVVSAIVGIVAHHAQAVKNEAATMNAAVPNFVTAMQMLFAQLNAGQFTPEIADIQIGQIVSDYYAQIAPILKKSGPCPTDDACETSYNGKFIAGITSCNAACSVGCAYVESIACKAKKLLRTGGTITIAAFGGVNSALTKQASFVLSFGNGGVGGVNYSQPTQAGGPLGGQVPYSLGGAGLNVGNGTIIPYSQLSTAQLKLAGLRQPSILDAVVPQSGSGKLLVLGGVALVVVLAFAASR